jgi:hypothetical protein
VNNEFIEFRCPNVVDDKRCGGECAGVSRETLEHYDFSKPFRDMRYCGKCSGFFEVILSGPQNVPTFRVLAKQERINFVRADAQFGLFNVEGRR